MANYYRKILLSGLLLLSANSWSSGTITQHAVSVSKAVSAFYMYILTEGDDRYYDEYVKILGHANDSFIVIKKENPKQMAELEPLWNKIQAEKNYKASAQDEFNVPSYIRIQFRNYLEKIYPLAGQGIISDSNIGEHMDRIALDVELIAAKFFDVSSSTLGEFTLTSNVKKSDPEIISKNMKQRLIKLQATVLDEKIKKNLRSIDNKWRFIENSVVNYNQESAFMLVYYNKNKIGKLIKSSQGVLASL